MFRLVLIHQLVLSLLVGPMLCCCTTARLGHDAGRTSQAADTGEQSPRGHCCGGHQKSPGGDRNAPGDETPGDPAKCPCKDSPAQAVAVPEVTPGALDSLTLLSAGIASFDLPAILDGPAGAPRPAARFDFLSSSVSTADLLFAHHNLRC